MKKLTTRQLVIVSVMLAITLIMDYTPLGVIPLPIVAATITHLPTIVTGIILGPLAGAIVGTGMGCISMFRAMTRPTSVLSPLFMNPLISIIPRIFIGIAAYYAYVAIKGLINAHGSKVKDAISIGVGAFIGSMTNTMLVMGMIYIVYKDRVASMLGIDSVLKWIAGIITGQAIIEAIVLVILTIPIVYAWRIINKNRRIA